MNKIEHIEHIEQLERFERFGTVEHWTLTKRIHL